MKSIKLTSLFIVITLATLLSCVKEEFIKACYDDTTIGCQNLDTNGIVTPFNSTKINFIQSTVTKDEDDGIATALITLSQPAESTIVIPFVVVGTLKTNDDIVLSGSGVSFNHLSRTGTFTIQAGQSTLNVFMTIIDDAIFEQTEDLTIILSPPSGKAVLDTSTTFTLYVEDNDSPPTIQFATTESPALGDPAIVEGATIPVTITLSSILDNEMTIPIVVSGTAEATGVNADHTFNQTTITVPAGVTSFDVFVTTIDDANFEVTETIIITIDPIANPLGVGTNDVHTIYLTDNDSPPDVEFAVAASAANESQGTASVTVNLSHAVQVDQTINFSYTGTATMGNDYTANASIVIPAGQTTGIHVINLINDLIYEIPENIIINISPSLTYNIGVTSTHTITVNDDDSEPVISFDYARLSYHAAENYAKVLIKSNNASGSNISINYNVSVSGSATPVSHHNLNAGTNSIILPAGQTEIALEIITSITAADENALDIILTLQDEANYALGAITTSQINIFNPRFQQIPHDVFGANELFTHKINDMIAVNSGFALATDLGLVIANTNFTTIKTYGSSRGLPSNKIQSMYYDESMKTLIVGTDRGAAIARYDHYSSFTPLTNLAYTNIKGAIIDGQNIFITSPAGVAISTNLGGSFSYYNTGSPSPFTLPTNNISKIEYDKQNQRIFLASDAGVIITDFALSTLTMVNATTVPGKINNNIVDITLSDNKQTFYVLTQLGVYQAPATTPLTGTLQAYAGFTLAQLRTVFANNTSGKIYVVGSSRISDSAIAKTSTLVGMTTVSFISGTGGRRINGKDYIFDSSGILESSDQFVTATRYSTPSQYPTNWKINAMADFDSQIIIGTDQGLYSMPPDLSSIQKVSVDNYKINQLKVAQAGTPSEALYIASDAGWTVIDNILDPLVYDPFQLSPLIRPVTSIAFDPNELFVGLGNSTSGLKIYNVGMNQLTDIVLTFNNNINDITYSYDYNGGGRETFLISTNDSLHQIDIIGFGNILNYGDNVSSSVFSYESASNPGNSTNLFVDANQSKITQFTNGIIAADTVVGAVVEIGYANFNSPASIYKVLFDSLEALHIGHANGYSLQPPYIGAPFINYTQQTSGLPTSQVRSILITQDQRVLLGTSYGLAISTANVTTMAAID